MRLLNVKTVTVINRVKNICLDRIKERKVICQQVIINRFQARADNEDDGKNLNSNLTVIREATKKGKINAKRKVKEEKYAN